MKMRMKAILVAMLAVVGIFTACSKNDDAAPANVGFSQETFAINANNEAVLKVTSTSAVSGEVGFTINTTLKEGEDYQVEKTAFTFNNNTEATVKVTFLKGFEQNTTFGVDLKAVNFGQLALSKAKVALSVADAILYTFDKDAYSMTASADLTLQLSKVTGSFTAEKEIVLEVEVDESSTAVEGVHFTFEGAKQLVIAPGKNNAKLKLNFIKHEAGKDKIVLKLKNAPIVFQPGNYEVANIQVLGTIFENLSGSWKYKAMTNKEWWQLNGAWTGDNLDLLPSNNSEADVLTFADGELKVSMTGDLKKYFRDSKLVNLGEIDETLQEVSGYPKVKIVLTEALVNVSFSATTIKERNAGVGFRTFTEGGVEILEVTIRDYEPTDFLQNTLAMYKGFGDSPILKSMPLRYHFVRKTN